ncbi:MAG: DMT family transporter [Chloroflexi bacterium]|nr:DMT family transporter [Chloroflexota bacterium]
MRSSRLNVSDSDLRRGTLAAVLSAASYSTAVVFVRYAYRSGLSSGTAIFLRFAMASAILILFLRWSGRWVRLPTSQVRALFLLGLVGYTIMGSTWFAALAMIPAWLVSLFIALHPLTITLGNWLLVQEPIDRQQALALAAVLVGGVVLFWHPYESAALTGVLLMLVNTLATATYVVVGQKYVYGPDPAVSTAWTILGAAAGTFLYALSSSQLSLKFAPAGWVWAALLALVPTVLAIVFLWQGVALIGPPRASIAGALEPPFSILLAVLLLGESMSFQQVLGGALILAGVLAVRLQATSQVRRTRVYRR